MLDTFVARKVDVFRKADKEKQIQSLEDKAECIIHLTGHTTTVQGLLDNIKTIFGDGKKAGVVFSTIHKAKGLEADNVWIIETQLMPHPMAKSKSDREQEMNLCYVAITRAKKILNYVGGRTGKA
jgi:superfamily I DNA/RNA helicase